MNKHARNRKAPHDATPLLEWILGGIGAVLFVVGIAYLTIEGLRGEDRPAEITFTVDEVLPAGNGFLVRYSAHNQGTQTLAEVQLRAEIIAGTTVMDEAQSTLDFLPGQSSRSGGFYLREDPSRYRLEIRAEGYQEP
jgi:uncharacterized protein (TIGR02588 family)